VILTAEVLLHSLHVHKYFSTVPSSVIVTPNKTEEFSLKKSAIRVVKEIIYYLSGGEQVDMSNLQEALEYYQVRKHANKTLNGKLICITFNSIF